MSDEGSEKLEKLLEAQRDYYASGATRSWQSRRDGLTRLEGVLKERRDDILQALADDLGKPDVEAYLAEYYFLLQELRLIRKKLQKWLKTRRVGTPPYFQPCRSSVRRDPFGAVLVMAPWNYPIQLSLSPLIAAVAAGNTVVLKPSEVAPATEKLLCEMIDEAFDPGHVAVVTGDADVASALLEQSFDFIFFTGSTKIGRIVAEKAAKQLAPHILELGGKCPCVVDASAKLDVSARRILGGKFFNGGQTCFAPDFVAVHAGVKDRLEEEFKKLLDEVPWGEEMARVIHERHYDRLEKLIPEGAMKFGMDDREKLRLAPRLVTDVNWDDELMEEEIFGPILPVIAYQDEVELLRRIHEMGTPLSLYLFSENNDWVGKMTGSVRSGGICINDTMKQGSNLNLPFGGVGESGYGRYRGKAGVEAFSYERAEVSRPVWAPEWMELMPPYGDTINWLKRFLR